MSGAAETLSRTANGQIDIETVMSCCSQMTLGCHADSQIDPESGDGRTWGAKLKVWCTSGVPAVD